ncbi:MAG TPA: capsule assembly Wzi family protein, partial [Methylomirabilota bacterium]|nr:capsule assembly Wzi family protein [Methylomirabilota bacterium]
FQGASNPSFPSTHSMLSFTVASVIAHEYPGWLTQTLVYTAASAVSIARASERQHFPGDIVIGGALGWAIGRQVYKAHSKFKEDDLYGPPAPSGPQMASEPDVSPRSSTFVPLDSWVYPALGRLAALGYIHTQFVGLQPWTRLECLRQLDEADYFSLDLPPESDVRQLVAALRAELSKRMDRQRYAEIESVYARYMNISGAPLRDSYHFGQTVWNDFGRPYDQGSNFIGGATASAVAGPFFFYVQGEYEHAPRRAALTPAQQTLINSMDSNDGIAGNPVGPAPAPIATTDRFYPLEMYAGVELGEYALTFGKQSLWLGPGESAPLMVSDNADPMYMLRLVHTSPFYLPWIFRYLGPVEDQWIFAKLSGHQFPARPFFNLQKISFHPTKNLEIGFTRASLWGGVGHPFTLHALERNFLALGDTPGGTFNNPADIGDRKSGIDFSYRVPGLRDWLTIYSDAYSDDDPSPLANPRRAAVSPGIYLSHFPALSKLDFRFEAVSTQSLTATDRGGQFLYFNFRYHDSNTNKGLLFGDSVGRDARAYQGFTTYHFSPKATLELSYRQLKVGNAFFISCGPATFACGGTQSDAIAKFAWRVRPKLSVDTFLQYERWLLPALHSTAQSDTSGSIQLTYHLK